MKVKSTFQEKVKKIVKKIPKGEVLTYKQVAQRAGNSAAARAVGNILNKNRDSQVPCHRVVRTDGTIGGYYKGVKKKRDLLRREGVIFWLLQLFF